MGLGDSSVIRMDSGSGPALKKAKTSDWRNCAECGNEAMLRYDGCGHHACAPCVLGQDHSGQTTLCPKCKLMSGYTLRVSHSLATPPPPP